MAKNALRDQMLEELSAKYAKMPAKLVGHQKEEWKLDARAQVLASTLVKIQNEAKAEGDHIGPAQAMQRLIRAVKSLDFMESEQAIERPQSSELTPSMFVGRVESYRKAARVAGETPTFAEAARAVLEHVESSA